MLWSLFAIDGLLARAAEAQRQAAADYVEAMVQTSMDYPSTAGLAARLDKAVARLAAGVRSPRRAVAVVVSPRDTVFSSAAARALFTSGAVTARSVRLPDGQRVPLLVVGTATTGGPRTALWVVGVLGILLLGLAVARERHPSLQVAPRSSALERLSIEALRANAMKSEFLANVSHELRTPLTAIVGFVEMLRDGVYGELAPRQGGPVDRIAASATHLRHLVDQILDIARIAAGRLEVSREMISLRPYVLNIATDL